MYSPKFNKYNKRFNSCLYKGKLNEVRKHFKKCAFNQFKCNICNKIILGINLKEHMCKKCNDICETCEFNGDNCTTCNQTSSFKYFFNSSCYEKCPNNTKLNETNNICEEIRNEKKDNKHKDGDDENDEDKNNSNSDSIMLSIFTIITAGLLFLTLFCFFRRYCCLNKKAPDNLLNEINTELREN